MTKQVTLETTDDGSLAVKKLFSGPSDGLEPQIACRSEAIWLAEARHPGVVWLLGYDDCTLRTSHCGAPTLRTANAEPGVAAAMLLSVAVTLADLHDRELVHGAVDPDHLLVATGQSLLCSPTGLATEQSADSLGLGRCIAFLRRTWDAKGVAHSSAWAELEAKLTDQQQPLGLRRAARLLAVLANEPAPGPRPSVRRTLRPGVGLLVLFLAVTIGGLTIVEPRPPSSIASSLNTQRLQFATDVYAVGDADDVVIEVPSPCPGQPVAFLLDRATSTVWSFARAEHESRATRVAIVPGATGFEIDDDRSSGCSSTYVVGPAGRSRLEPR